MRSIRIAIFGAGSLGGVVGALLSKRNDILLITRGKNLNVIKEKGLRVEGHTSGIYYFEAESYYPGGFDLIILTVKAYDTREAVEDIMKEYSHEPVITFQNGVGIVELLRELDIIPGVTTHGATLLEPGVVKHAGIGDTYIGEINGELTPRLFEIAKNFTQCGLVTEVVNDIIERRWIKAAINACINPLTAILNVPNGKLLNRPLIEIVECVAEECALVLADKGIKVDLTSQVLDVARKTAYNYSSMLQDLKRGKKTEIDYITKPFISGGCNRILYHMVKYLENR